MCSAEAIEVASKLLGGLNLVLSKQETNGWPAGQYALSRGIYADVVFPPVRWLPETEIDEDSSEEENKKFFEYIGNAEGIEPALRVHPVIGHEIVKACIEQGWDQEEHGHINFFIYNKITEAITRWQEDGRQ